MVEDNEATFSPAIFVNIQEGIFDKFWSNAPEEMKKILLANPNATVTLNDGEIVLLDKYVAIICSRNNSNS